MNLHTSIIKIKHWFDSLGCISAGALALLVSSGCMLEQGDAAEGSDEASVGSISQALVVDPTIYQWAQGNGATILGPGSGYSGQTHTCFLTRVRGHFRGGGEVVRTYISTPAGGGIGTWRLGGSSAQTGVLAEAICVQKPPMAEQVWNQGEPAALLGEATGLFCGLTLVKGNFAGSGERLEVYGNYNFSPPRWTLSGASQQQSVAGRARCIAAHQMNPAQGSYTYATGTNLAAVNGQACVLGRVQGPFRGTVDSTQIINAGNGYWQLTNSGGAKGAARCAQ